MTKDTFIYPLSAIPLYHVRDTGFRVSADSLNELENLPTHPIASSTEFNAVLLTENINVLCLDSLKEARKICKYYLDKYVKEICGYNEEFIITNSWLTRNKKGSKGHWPHRHPNSIFSGCLYLNAGAEESSISFHYRSRISEDFKFTYTKCNDTIYNSTELSVPVKTGSILIFPSTLKHSVPSHTADSTRITLCFNTFVKDKFGSIAYSSDIDLSNISFGNELDDVNFKYN
jgi:hypothetical protein